VPLLRNHPPPQQELDALASKHADFTVVYTVSKPAESWAGEAGRINDASISKFLPAPATDVLIGVCGPDPLVVDVCGPRGNPEVEGMLQRRGYARESVYKF
jgi:cytochrome-b5 reductase